MFASLLTKGVFFPFLMRSLSNFHLLPSPNEKSRKVNPEIDWRLHSSLLKNSLRSESVMAVALASLAFLVASAIGYSPWGATRLAAAAARTCPSSRTRVMRLNAADESSFEGAIASFAPRQDLPSVRGQLAKLQEQLNNAVEDEEYVLAAMLRDDLQELKSKDPAAMAVAVRAEMNEHVACERYDEAALCRDQLMVLRRFLPQYQLAGLWKGARRSPSP